MDSNNVPPRVRYAVWLFYVALATLAIRATVSFIGDDEPTKTLQFLVFFFLLAATYGVQLVLIQMIRQGRGWARFALAAMMYWTLPSDVVYLYAPHRFPSFYHPKFGLSTITAIGCIALMLIGLAMLFGGSVSEWFANARRKRAQVRASKMSSTISESRAETTKEAQLRATGVSESSMKPLLKILDVAARVSALLVALALLAFLFSPFGFFLGVFASDSGPTGILWYYGMGLVVSLWLLICSVRPAALVGRLRQWPVLDLTLTRIPVYVVAVFAISLATRYATTRYDLAHIPGPVAPAVPALNDHASQALQFGGSVPSSVPLDDFVAVYQSEVDGRIAPGPCQQFFASGSKELWRTLPLRHEQEVPLQIQEGRYQGEAYFDRYLPDQCHWHLTALYFRVRVEGRPYYPPGLGPGQVRIVYDPQAARGVQDRYTGPGRLWCRSRDQLAPELRFYCGGNDSERVVWVRGGDNASVEYDFYDGSVPPRK